MQQQIRRHDRLEPVPADGRRGEPPRRDQGADGCNGPRDDHDRRITRQPRAHDGGRGADRCRARHPDQHLPRHALLLGIELGVAAHEVKWVELGHGQHERADDHDAGERLGNGKGHQAGCAGEHGADGHGADQACQPDQRAADAKPHDREALSRTMGSPVRPLEPVLHG